MAPTPGSSDLEFTVRYDIPEYLSLPEALEVQRLVNGSVVYMRRNPRAMAAFVKDSVILDEGLFLVLEVCCPRFKENIDNKLYIMANYDYIECVEPLLAGIQ